MKIRLLLSVFAALALHSLQAQPIVDCSCLATQAVLRTNACFAVVPDMCQFTNCFIFNAAQPPPMCSQFPPAGSPASPGTNVITVTVTDVNGVGQQCVLDFVVTQPTNSGPFSFICASNKTVQCGSTWTFDPPGWTNACCPNPGTPGNGVTIFFINTVTNGTCPQVITRTWMGRDDCGHVSQCSQSVTVVDNVPPTINCGQNETVFCGMGWGFTVPIISDNCTAPSDLILTSISTTTNFLCGFSMVATQIWKVTDNCGNSTFCTQVVTTVDNVAPTITCASNKTVECRTQWAFDPPAAVDFCGGAINTNVTITIVNTVTNGFCPRFITRTWQATDGCSNSAQCSQTVTVVDTTPPLLDCNCLRDPAVVQLNVIGCSNAIPDLCALTAQCAQDNCGPLNCSQSPPAGTIVTPGVYPITVTVTDCASNSATCIVDFVLTAPPQGCDSCTNKAQFMSLFTGADANGVLAPGATDTQFTMSGPGAPPQPLVIVNPNGSWVPNSPASQWIGPTLTSGSSALSGLYIYTNYFYLDCTNDAAITGRWTSDDGGAIWLNGIDTGHYVNIPFGHAVWHPVNIASGFQVGWNSLLFFVTNGPSATGLRVEVTGTNCNVCACACDFFNGDFELQVPVNGTGNGWTSFDVFGGAGWDPIGGNPGAGFLLNNVGDPTTDPTVSQRLCCFKPGQCYTIRGQRKVQQWFGDTNLSFAVLLDGAPILLLPVPSIPANANWYNFSVSFTATSQCHTIGFAAEILGTDVSYWIDNISLECCSTNTNNCVSISCSTNISVQTCTNGAVVTYPAPTAMSLCGTAITNVVCVPPSGSFFPLGTTPVICTATDAQGNSASCSFQVTVFGDTTVPNCPPLFMSVTGCPPRMPNFQTNGLVTDNCTPSALISVTQSIPPGTPLTPGSPIVVILTICDAAGNCRVCDVIITPVSSLKPPKINCPKDITVITCSNSAMVKYKVAGAGGPIVCTPPSGTIFPLGTNIVTCSITNACGEWVSCSFKVIVKFGLSVNPTVTITAGLPDNFAPNVEVSPPSACMVSAFSGFPFWKGFDSNAVNMIMGHRFTGLPANIVQAELIIRMRPMGDPGADNDGLFIGLPSSCAPSSFLYGQSIKVLPGASPPTGGTWVGASNGPTTFTLNLGALNPLFIPKLNADGFLDVVVHDDTTVDYMRLRLWTCPPKHPGIGIPFDVIGTATVAQKVPSVDDPVPVGPALCIFPDPVSPPSGILLSPGTPQKITFTTELSFDAPGGAMLQLALPNSDPVNPGFEPLATLHRCANPPCPSWDIKVNKRMFVSDSGNFRSIAINTNGHMFPSISTGGGEPDIEDYIRLLPQPGVTSVVLTVTIDCDTREISFEIPECIWTPDNARKGWDGCIYGNPRPSKPTKGRLSMAGNPPLMPRLRIGTVPLALLASGLPEVGVENPTVTSQGRKWGDGHVTLMKAYDDGETARKIEWTSFGEGGGVHVDLGRASSFRVGIHHFENGDIPNEEQLLRIKGPWVLTNRPAPPNIPLRMVKGLSGDEFSVDFTDLDATGVTVELWLNGVLIGSGHGDGPIIPPEEPLIVRGRPEQYECPAPGQGIVLRGEQFMVSGLVGDEIRIIPELPGKSSSFEYMTELEILTSEGMESVAFGLEYTPACTPAPLSIQRSSTATILSWSSEGFRVQGAENITGPWYDLGVESPVTVETSASMRYFRLICD
jgi:hypothetical protein